MDSPGKRTMNFQQEKGTAFVTDNLFMHLI